ncbi:MAG: hypothetical protein F4117_04610 [Acidimicrobiales bacterium]|nr:hypothetical protein [Acidimicrobiales bacterium]MXX42575.1 hypothetical protein [Acidimicrobiales bacterium]MYA24944.1 hypothetical protein [Acidimicrobiales bacterium]MYB82749.1 hypothetical protein [Acidimicrobiales bacterium]MYD32500.1 hypothetical protein [Acidimicrobiales bacterium]
MKLLFDQNLSRRLVRLLDREFPDSRHVVDYGLGTATDREIWDHAAAHGYVIVSKDSDFRQLAFLYGPPPKAIWVRVGNVSTRAVLDVLQQHRELIEEFEDDAEGALLVLPLD